MGGSGLGALGRRIARAPKTHMERGACRQPAGGLNRMRSHNNWGQIQLVSCNEGHVKIATTCWEAGRYEVKWRREWDSNPW